MEKFSQFRDKGSGVSPFLPISTPAASMLWSAVHASVFFLRLPFFLSFAGLYFLFLHHLPLPVAARKLLFWGIMAIPGIWWVDLQIDGVKRGSLSSQPADRVPHPRSVIAANFTSPIDALYLAAIFDPIFTISYPNSRKVRRIGLLRAILMAFSGAQFAPPPPTSGLTDLRALLSQNQNRVIVVFPECGTTNGKGIMPLSPSLVAVPADAAIFPVSLRYTPPDITTPVPGPAAWLSFLWKLLSRPTHCIRIRIAEHMYNNPAAQMSNGLPEAGSAAEEDRISGDEQRLLDRVAEALARLGRAKRVGLTMEDKKAFVKAWKTGRK
ncbi:hypothetical protein B0H66DRAFT_573778 [Apodospora peruviana]|uniref:Phospholipid/glycerol acyltransferase domain-containing protein n=1 Tax=Apodospora peruviana TaxID=516989 RepID=A0AAE0MBD9_9PEZI|nr:hypothetical protein B0H66DRAFT_573778 [Apodospora peruviana]